MAINSGDRDGRTSCQQTGFCFQGCKWGAKWSTLYTEIPKGEATGKLEVRANSHVVKIEHDDSGKVTNVVYADKDGKLQSQKARVVCVACNSIESPRLLLNSASSKYPDGLANSSGQVGKNYMRHTTGSVYAIFDKKVHMYRGTTMAGIIRDEARHDPSRGFVGGYELETLSLGLPFMAAFLNPGGWGRSFTTALDHYNSMAGMWIVGEDMPQEQNAVKLHGELKDKHGLPIPDVWFTDHPNDVAMRNHAYKQGMALYDAVGATRTFPTPPYPSTHNLGTNRMSEKASDGVVNKHRTDARHQEPVRVRWQPVHDRRCRKPDADDRHAGDPAGRLHRPRNGIWHDLGRECPCPALRREPLFGSRRFQLLIAPVCVAPSRRVRPLPHGRMRSRCQPSILPADTSRRRPVLWWRAPSRSSKLRRGDGQSDKEDLHHDREHDQPP